jgi:hypothetical protein
MKIAVISAIFGDMEKEKPFVYQSVDCHRYVFTPANSPFPLTNLPPRLQAKYFKLQAHHVLPNYDAYVWIDGNIEVTNPDFVRCMTESLHRKIRIQKHHERETIFEEVAFILGSDNPYLTTRYGNQPLKQEYEYYLHAGMPHNTPLFSCNIFSWDNSIGNKYWFNEWWNLVLQWSWFDQSAFSYLHFKYANSVETVDFGPMLNNDYFILHPHDNWNQ